MATKFKTSVLINKKGETRVWFLGERVNPNKCYIQGQTPEEVIVFLTKNNQIPIKITDRR